jgi:hypothetical protein
MTDKLTDEQIAAISAFAAELLERGAANAARQATADDLEKRLYEYFAGGGLFNPELANHQAVSELLRDCRDALAAKDAEIERLTRERDEAQRENIDMMWQRRRADERATDAEARIDALEVENARLRDEARNWESRYAHEIQYTSTALGERFTLVPPDGGDVKLHKAAKAAIDALAAAEARVAKLEAELARLREAANQQIGGHELLLLAVDADDPASEIKARVKLALKDARAALEAGHE